MKCVLTVVLALCTANVLNTSMQAQEKKEVTLKSILLEQLRSTHKTKGTWFVDAATAVAGLTPEQASWRDGKGNHSVGQLLYHLAFWNRFTLEKLKGDEKKFTGSNEETFDTFDAKRWDDTQRQFDEVMTEYETLVEQADEAKLKSWASTIEHICAHNAYHIGEIVYVRKSQGSWDPKKGVN
jgi:uncharacterized damage-inducible protein DinB